MAYVSRRFFMWLLGGEIAVAAIGCAKKAAPILAPSAEEHLYGSPFDYPANPRLKQPEDASFSRIGDYPGTVFVLPDTHLSPADVTPEIVRYAQWHRYLSRRDEFTSALHIIANGSDAAAASSVAGWKDMLSHAGRMHNRFAQAKTVFDWISQNIIFDSDKGRSHPSDPQQILDWWRPAHETLRSRKGVCIDQTLLLMEGLLLLGFKPETFKIDVLRVKISDDGLKTISDADPHAALDLHLEGKRLVFDLTDQRGIWMENGYHAYCGYEGEYKAPTMAIGFDKVYEYNRPDQLAALLGNDVQVPVLFTLSKHDQALYDQIKSLSNKKPLNRVEEAIQPFQLKTNRCERPWTVLDQPGVFGCQPHGWRHVAQPL